MSDKIYTSGLLLKEIDGQYGPILKASIKVDDFKQFLDENSKGGWVNVDINKNKNPTAKGYTHHGVVNTWKPRQESGQQSGQEQGQQGMNMPNDEDFSDVPIGDEEDIQF